MADQKKAKGGAEAEENEPLLGVIRIGVLNYQGMLVEEGRLSFRKRHAVLLLI